MFFLYAKAILMRRVQSNLYQTFISIYFVYIIIFLFVPKLYQTFISIYFVISLYILMKREFDAKLRKVGNSFVVTIPAIIVQKFKLKANQFIDISINKE